MLEKTLSIIKPDGTQRNLIGKILTCFEEKNLQISAMKMKKLTLKEAQGFYIEHKDRPFYDELVNYMISAPVVLMVLSGENAINKNREIMGATNPEEAAEGTIRKSFAKSVGENTVHGSDSQASAKREIDYFFSESEITK